MEIQKTLKVDQIDLSDPEFWLLPVEEREGALREATADPDEQADGEHADRAAQNTPINSVL